MARTRRTRPPTLRAELATAFGVFALFLQALLPGAALAHAGRGGVESPAICSLAGAHASIDAAHGSRSGKGFAGLACLDCVTCAVAATAAPSPATLAVRNARLATEAPHPPELTPRLARAPPRPPGQGPPQA
jgi:hypothetical protein